MTVCERAPALPAEGAGIQLGPNATRILRDWGVLGALARAACRPRHLTLHDAGSRRELVRAELATICRQRYGAPYLTLARADLVAALAHAAGAAGAAIRHDCAVEGWSEAPLTAITTDGALAACVLVLADGIGSRLRTRLDAGATLRDSGWQAWRASSRHPVADEVHVACLPGRHLVRYPIDGGAAANFVLVEPAGVAPFPTVAGFARSLPEKALTWRSWPIGAVAAPRWTAAGGIALIGDAAHALPPFAAAGGAMAIEDGAALGPCLGDGTNIAAGLARWETARRRRIAGLARAVATAERLFHARGALRLARNAALAIAPPALSITRYDWLYGVCADGG